MAINNSESRIQRTRILRAINWLIASRFGGIASLLLILVMSLSCGGEAHARTAAPKYKVTTPYGGYEDADSLEQACERWGANRTAYYHPSYAFTEPKYDDYVGYPKTTRLLVEPSIGCTFTYSRFWTEVVWDVPGGRLVPREEHITNDPRAVGHVKCPVELPYLDRKRHTCGCGDGMVFSAAAQACRPLVVINKDRPEDLSCNNPKVGNPLYPLTGQKRTNISVINQPWINVSLAFSNKRRLFPNVADVEMDSLRQSAFGPLWDWNHNKVLVRQSRASNGKQATQVYRGDANWMTFAGSVFDTHKPAADVHDALYGGVAEGWNYYDRGKSVIEVYNTNGYLVGATKINGHSTTYQYSQVGPGGSALMPGQLVLSSIKDPFGRAVAVHYKKPRNPINDPLVASLSDNNGSIADFTYDLLDNLVAVSWADGSSKEFLYEDLRHPWALTCLRDELEKCESTYSYDDDSRAIATTKPNADTFAVSWSVSPTIQGTEHYENGAAVVTYEWQAPAGVQVTGPLDTQISFQSTTSNGFPLSTSKTQPAGSGCAASASSQVFDSNSNVTQRDDFNGARRCYAYDTSRNLETTRVEGLANTASCSGVAPNGATLPAGSRKTSTQWHPDWRLQTRFAEPQRITTSVYNGRPDPFTVCVRPSHLEVR